MPPISLVISRSPVWNIENWLFDGVGGDVKVGRGAGKNVFSSMRCDSKDYDQFARHLLCEGRVCLVVRFFQELKLLDS